MNDKVIMEKIIPEKLREIEEHENVRILYAVESGSRAWGFASPDSDFDVRFVYIRPREFYLRLDKTRDVIEWQLDETLDINGWDITKFLGLMHKSNPTVFEWCMSPIVYKRADEWASVFELVLRCFRPKAMLYHYLNMAKTSYKLSMQEENVKLKRYLYVLRPLLACRHIIDKGTAPPMLFSALKDAYLDSALMPLVNSLLEAKMATPELGMGAKIPELNSFFNAEIERLDKLLSETKEQKIHVWNEVNELFLKLLG